LTAAFAWVRFFSRHISGAAKKKRLFFQLLGLQMKAEIDGDQPQSCPDNERAPRIQKSRAQNLTSAARLSFFAARK